jgi:hypothetical protein
MLILAPLSGEKHGLKFKERADLALRKSIVLLRNEDKTLPVPVKTMPGLHNRKQQISMQ